MQISILGFGNVGSRLAQLWTGAGHSVVVGLRSGSTSGQKAESAGLRVVEPAAAVEASPIVVIALPWPAVEATLRSIPSWRNKIVVDAANPINQDLRIVTPEAGSGAQQVALWAPEAKVVKAFNTIGAALFGKPQFDLLYCSDDADAKRAAFDLIESVKMRPQDAGPLKNAVYLEHIAGLWIDLAVNGRIQGAFGFNLIR